MFNISSAQVFAAADQLAREGKKPSFTAVREMLGSGSKTTILKYLQDWRNGVSKPVSLAVTFSSTLNSALANELTSYAGALRAEVESKLVETEDELAVLIRDGELLERERDELTRRLQEMTTDRDTVQGRATQQARDMASLSDRLEREQSALGEVQVQLATEKLRLVDLQKRDVDQLTEIQRQEDLIQAEAKTRIAAEQLAAVLSTKLDHSLDLMARAEASNADLSKLLSDATTDLRVARGQMLALQAEHTALNQKNQDSQLAAQEAIGAARQADRTAAELRGRLDAMQDSQLAAQEAIGAARQADRTAAELQGRLDAMKEWSREVHAHE
jgi:colicin import membrane protein